MRFNPPPGWPTPPEGWSPPTGWTPPPAWPAAPEGWQLWLPDESVAAPAAMGQRRSPDTAVPETPVPARVAGPAAQPGPGPTDSAALLARIAELENALATAQASTSHVIELSDQRASGRRNLPLPSPARERRRLPGTPHAAQRPHRRSRQVSQGDPCLRSVHFQRVARQGPQDGRRSGQADVARL